jgi:Fe2+ transport system protein B
MMDEAEAKGLQVDSRRLSALLGVPVVPMVAVKGEGVTEALQTAVAVAEGVTATRPVQAPLWFACGNLRAETAPAHSTGRQRSKSKSGAMVGVADAGRGRIGAFVVDECGWRCATDVGRMPSGSGRISALRWIWKLPATCTNTPKQSPAPSSPKPIAPLAIGALDIGHWSSPDWTEILDNLLTHRWLGIPLTLAIFGGIFWLTAIGANKPSALLEEGVSWLMAHLRAFANSVGMPWWLKGVLIDGVLLGVGTVFAVMFPPMLLFYVLYAVLEDFGLVPRIAFNLDSLMQKVGSQGKHCLSCMVSYGCNIPGVLATRVIEDPRVRLIAILTAALNPCNGRWGNLLPLSLLLFGKWAPLALVALIAISFVAVPVRFVAAQSHNP